MDKGIDTNFIHTDHFVLIDSNRHVRGYYHGLDSASLKQLSTDIIYLTMEKDPTRKSFLAGKLATDRCCFPGSYIECGTCYYSLSEKKKNMLTPGIEKK